MGYTSEEATPKQPASAELATSSSIKATPVSIQPSSGGGSSAGLVQCGQDEDGDDGASVSSSSSSVKRQRRKSRLKENEKCLSSSPPSSSSSSKRKNLAALLSTSIDEFKSNLHSTPKKVGGGAALREVGGPAASPPGAATTSSTERMPGRSATASLQSRSSSGSVAGGSAGTAGAATADGVEGRRSPSLSHALSQGVKSLQERHKLNREAIETFKTMKGVDGSEAVERKASGESLVADAGAKAASTAALDSAGIPEQLLRGEAMLKVTPKKVMQRVFRLDSDRGQILWESKKNNKVNLESIRELRTGASASSYRTSMSISVSHEPRWISIIYQTGGVYKALHLIALSDQAFTRWKDTLAAVQDERKMLMSGVDLLDQRQQLWLRQHWKSADSSQDARLDFSEVTKLCRRLGILSNGKDLRDRFREADAKGKGFLDFEDFQHFVSLLKRRVDVEALFLRWADVGVQQGVLQQGGDCTSDKGLEAVRDRLHKAVLQATISPDRFQTFLVTQQKYHSLDTDAVLEIVRKYSDGGTHGIGYTGFLSFLMSFDNALLSDQCSLSSTLTLHEGKRKSRAEAQTTEELVAISVQGKQRHDMGRPMSEYFISSSHNTYLVGGQWKGDSTAEGYVRALLQGARSVEIDCWNGPGNEPQVTHGRTLTSKVPFRDVITAIERYAFIASPFPVILSLEVHNDLAQQDVLAVILREILGDKLLSEPLAGREAGGQDSLPSPRDLQGKVLVKAKNLYVVDAAATQQQQQQKVSVNEQAPAVVVEETATTHSTTDTTESESDGILTSARGLVRSVTKRKAERPACEGEGKAGAARKVLMSPGLASLLIYTVGVKHRGINKKEHYSIEHMISLSEKSGLKYLKSEVNGEDLVKHNRSHLTRVYPSMSSFKRLSQSANFLPTLFWSMGCQLVAINWQTLDVGYEMNQAMFARNARCGYVLKPEALRVKESGPRQRVEVQLSICIISAQQLPRFRDASRDKEMEIDDVLDPFVSLCVVVPQHRDYDVRRTKAAKRSKRTAQGLSALLSDLVDGIGSEGDGCDGQGPLQETGGVRPPNRWMSRQRTSVFPSNGFNPIWNETLRFSLTFSVGSSAIPDAESVQARTRGLLDLCFLRFEVREDSLKASGGGSESGTAQAAPSSVNNDGGKRTDVGNPTRVASPTSYSSSSSSSSDEGGSRAGDSATAAGLESLGEDAKCLATHMVSLGSLEQGYRHVPLYDAQLSQYLFSTLFVKTEMRIVTPM